MKNKFPILIFSSATILILWQMLLPGYIITLDMSFAPKIKMFVADSGFYNFLPVFYFLQTLNIFMDGWLIQKIMMLTLFFSMGYSAYRFLPLGRNEVVKIWAGIFYMANPFVYERLLAGHWHLLFAYAMLPAFIHYLLAFGRGLETQTALRLFFYLFLIGVMSPHLLVMALIFLSIWLIVILTQISGAKQKRKKYFAFFKNFIIGASLSIAMSSYWFVPYLLQPELRIYDDFGQANFEAFRTAGDIHLGAAANVLALYGFWGERENWAEYWLWPKDNMIFFGIIFTLLLALLSNGIYSAWRQKKNERFFFLTIGALSFIFSLGLADSIFKPLNQWFFDNVSIWSGFRDSQKWSAWLVVSTVYFCAQTISILLEKINKLPSNWRNNLTYSLFLFPIMYTYPLWGGFARQLQPIWYPETWHEANRLLNNDGGDFKVLFLPWHGYMSFDFNNKIISSNLAKKFFDKPVIQGENMEIGGIYRQGGRQENTAIELILNNIPENSPETSLKLLRNQGVKYLLYSKKETLKSDEKMLDKLASNSAIFKKIADFSDLTIFEIVLR